MLDFCKNNLLLYMKDFEKEAIETAIYWNEEGFNKRNIDICLEFLHFPHIRLWENEFSIHETFCIFNNFLTCCLSATFECKNVTFNFEFWFKVFSSNYYVFQQHEYIPEVAIPPRWKFCFQEASSASSFY